MNQLHTLLEKAKKSSLYLFILNFFAKKAIPFNYQHKIDITKVTDNSVEIKIPYKKYNFNHVKGIHACGLATVSEYATGFMLMSRLDPKNYRLIMKEMIVSYHFQAKTNAYARFSMTQEWFNENVIVPLKTQDAIFLDLEVNMFDESNNHLTTAKITWQIKNWSKVKTKV